KNPRRGPWAVVTWILERARTVVRSRRRAAAALRRSAEERLHRPLRRGLTGGIIPVVDPGPPRGGGGRNASVCLVQGRWTCQTLSPHRTLVGGFCNSSCRSLTIAAGRAHHFAALRNRTRRDRYASIIREDRGNRSASEGARKADRRGVGRLVQEQKKE